MIEVIDEHNHAVKTDIICESPDGEEKQECRLFFTSSFDQISFKSFKLIPRTTEQNTEEITHQAIYKGFKLRFSKLVSFSVDDDFTKFEYKVCKPREEESYSESKKTPKIEMSAFIETGQDESEGRNVSDEDKDVHICLTEKFVVYYKTFLSRKCGQKGRECSTKFDFSPNQEFTEEIVNASIYVGREVFELKVFNFFIN